MAVMAEKAMSSDRITVTMTVGVMMLDHVAVGDYVVQHVGYAIARLDRADNVLIGHWVGGDGNKVHEACWIGMD